MDARGSGPWPALQGTRERDPAAALLARWQEEGDQEALEELLRLEIVALKARIRREAQGMTNASNSASDIAQEVAARFLGVGTGLHFQHPSALRRYLWTAAWRLLLAQLQRGGRSAGQLLDES